jgi:hypothetical protein
MQDPSSTHMRTSQSTKALARCPCLVVYSCAHHHIDGVPVGSMLQGVRSFVRAHGESGRETCMAGIRHAILT